MTARSPSPSPDAARLRFPAALARNPARSCGGGLEEGLIWGPETRAATFFDPRPRLLADSTTLTCQAQVPTQDFELFKDGVVWDHVHVDTPAMEHRFLLAGETGDTHGLYRCRSGFGSGWTQLSNLLEVTEDGSLPPPLLSVEPVSWITPGLNITLLCQGARQGVTFSLKREGDSTFLEVAEAGPDGQATFPVHQAGNYSCSYRTHTAGDPSGPSATVTIEELAVPPPPRLDARDRLPRILKPGASMTLKCVAPLSGVEFRLQQGKKDLLVPMSSTSPDRVFFHLNEVALGDSGPYTCSYRLRQEHSAWSRESAPLELVLSDGTLPAPELSAEPPSLRPEPGARVRLRCRGPRAGLRFALVREDTAGLEVRGLLSPPGAEASFELHAVSVVDSANYSCIYVDPAPPFAGSVASEPLELRVDGPRPRPQLRPLWSGAVTPGRDAVLRCESSVPGVAFELLRTGEEEAVTSVGAHGPSADLELPYVGPRHAGNYSCRYRVWGPGGFVSELSDPVELLVAGR